MKSLRVLVLLDPSFMPPDSLKGFSEQEINVWKTEYDVISTLRANGHEVRPLGVQHALKPIRDEIESWKPDVVFNLLEQFHHEPVYDQHIPSFLELMRIPYTGCNPRGLILARGKDLSKTLVHHRRIAVRAPHLLAVPHLVAGTGLMATLTRRFAALHAAPFGLRLLPLPFLVDGFTVTQTWHRRHDEEPAHRWLRTRIAEVAAALG